MTFLKTFVTVSALASAMAWSQATPPSGSAAGQQPAAPSAAPQGAGQPQAPAAGGNAAGAAQTASGPSTKTNVSGCLQHGFAHFQISDQGGGTTYQLRGNGANLANFENHVVQIQGIPD